MIKNIPQFQKQRIERETVLKLPAREHSSEKKNAAVAKKQEELIGRLKDACTRIKSADPTAYKSFETILGELYGSCYAVSRRSPLDYIGAQVEGGMQADSGYFGLVQAYTSGQIVILESLFDIFEIKAVGVGEAPTKEKWSIFVFLIDRVSKFCSKLFSRR